MNIRHESKKLVSYAHFYVHLMNSELESNEKFEHVSKKHLNIYSRGFSNLQKLPMICIWLIFQLSIDYKRLSTKASLYNIHYTRIYKKNSCVNETCAVCYVNFDVALAIC